MSIYMKKVYIGGHGGNVFHCYGGSNGKVLEKIQVWAIGDTLAAVKVWLTGDSPKTYGHPKGTAKDFAFHLGERITSLSLWGDGKGTSTGGIQFETSEGRTFSHQMTVNSLQKEFKIDVGSGICVGIVGRSGNNLDKLGFVFLKPIESSTLTNVHFPTLDLEKQAIMPIEVDSISTNSPPSTDPNHPDTWDLEGDTSQTTSYSFSLTVGAEISEEFSVEAQIPELAKVGSKTTWKLSVSTTLSMTHSETQSFSWSRHGTLKPGQTVDAVAIIRKGSLSIPFMGTMVVRLKNRRKFSYPVEGTYVGESYNGVDIDVNLSS